MEKVGWVEIRGNGYWWYEVTGGGVQFTKRRVARGKYKTTEYAWVLAGTVQGVAAYGTYSVASGTKKVIEAWQPDAVLATGLAAKTRELLNGKG